MIEMEYLLDTNICIYIIKRKPIEIFNRFSQLPLGKIGISTITLAELIYGVAKSSSIEKNTQALQEYLVPLDIIDFDSKAAVIYGRVRSELEKVGQVIGPLDMLIAAHGLSAGLTVVTNNEKEFERVKGLKVENWVKK